MLLGEIKRKHTEHAQHEPSSSNEDSKNRSKQRKEQREREREIGRTDYANGIIRTFLIRCFNFQTLLFLENVERKKLRHRSCFNHSQEDIEF